MIRNTAELATGEFDVLVLGGGVLGAFVARNAARSGFTTALIERSDFSSKASGNSLKIIHGGFRYLQSLDFIRPDEAIRPTAEGLVTHGSPSC